MSGIKVLGTLCAALAVALVLDVAVCLLPENDYQRWQLLDGTIYQQLRWVYERIHFDPRPIDIAILGPSKSLLGLSADRIEQQLRLHGATANVVNFSVIAEGRNIEWAIANELYKSKRPKIIVIAVDANPYLYGHSAFKYVAPALAIASPPALMLHNYFYDITYLPARKAKLFAASLFPNLFGLRKHFDEKAYARTRTDFTFSFRREDGQVVDMDREVPRGTLLAQAKQVHPPTFLSRALVRCCNDGDDQVYIREIAKLAKAHGTRLIFDYLPTFNGPEQVSDRKFLDQYGEVLDNTDLLQQDKLFENWGHLNHAGAIAASDILAKALTAPSR